MRAAPFDVWVPTQPSWEIAALVAHVPTSEGVQQAGPEALERDALRHRWDVGGSGLNAARWLAAAGLRVAAVGRCADDEPTRSALARLAEAGVALRYRQQSGRTGRRTAVVRQVGTDALATALWLERGAIAPHVASDVAGNASGAAEWLHLDRVSEAAVQWAGACGRYSVDLHTFPHRRANQVRAVNVVRGARVAQLRGEAAAQLAALLACGCDPASLRAALGGRPDWLVITRGASGSSGASAAGERPEQPALVAKPFVESTGAGDAYASALVEGFMGGWSLARAMQIGAGRGAAACEWLGAYAGREVK